MKKIRIIQGVFGLRQGSFTLTKTKNDPPFEVDDEVAKRLIKQGVATYAETSQEGETKEPVKTTQNLGTPDGIIVNKSENGTAENEVDNTGKETDNNTQNVVETNALYSMQNTKNELAALVKELGGGDVDPKLNKAQIIELLDQITAADGEDEPSFSDVDGIA